MIIDLISIVVVLEKLADHLRRLDLGPPFGPTSCVSVVHFVMHVFCRWNSSLNDGRWISTDRDLGEEIDRGGEETIQHARKEKERASRAVEHSRWPDVTRESKEG